MFSTVEKMENQITRKTSLINELRAAWSIAKKEWIIRASYPLEIIYFALSPFLWMIPVIFFGLSITGGADSTNLAELVGTSDWKTFIILGMVFTNAITMIIYGAGYSFRREQNRGTLESIYVSPISRTTLLSGFTLHYVSFTLISTLIQIIAAIILFGININALGIAVALLSFGIAITGAQGIVFIFSCFVLKFRRAWITTEIAINFLLFITPAAYPIAVLPTVFQVFSKASPLTWGLTIFRSALMPDLIVSYDLFVNLIISTIILFALGWLLFRFIESSIRKTGSLQKF